MCKSNCRVRRVDTLSTVSRSSHYVNTNIFFINVHIHIFRLRHNCYRTGRCLNSSLRFRLRHTLYTVNTRFIFQYRICASSCNHKVNRLHTTDTSLVCLKCFHFPASALCIMHIHTINFSRKQRSLFSTCTCTNFNDNVLIIVRILRKKQNLQFILKFCKTRLGFIQFFLCKLTHLFIGFFAQHSK